MNDILIKTLEKNNKNIAEIAKLHKKAFPKFFLTQLGITFLKTLYLGYVEDKESGVLVAVNEHNNIVGFLAYSKSYSQFYRNLMRKHLVKFGICSAFAVIRHPSFFKRLLGAFKKSDEVKRKEKYVELASIGVLPQVEGKGIGSRLIEELKTITDFDEYAYINLETDAEENEIANHFYVKNGFMLSRSYETAQGRKMNEYRYNG